MEEYPRAILGAGKQAGHVLFLLEWMGLPWKDCMLFDDNYETSKIGPRNLPIAGTLQDGIRVCRQNQLSAMVALGSRFSGPRYALFLQAIREGIHPANLIHPSCVLAPTSIVG